MTPNTLARMVVVKKEDKELKLRQLIIDGLAALAMVPRTSPAAAPVLRLVAASMASPVVRAVSAMQDELVAAGIEARVILAKADAGPAHWIGRASSYRQLADLRCHDAHEALVLAANTAWIGDCMRRDPATRDSFELYAPDCALTLRLATASFEKLWSRAAIIEPCEDRASLDMAGDLAALGQDGATAPQVLTRH